MPSQLPYSHENSGSEPWVLMLLFNVDAWCDSWAWGYWDSCNTRFTLDAYGLKASLQTTPNVEPNRTSTVPTTFVWTINSKSASPDERWNSTSDNGILTNGFRCSDISLNFSHPLQPNGTWAELHFDNLKVAFFVNTNQEQQPKGFSRMQTFNKCRQDRWPRWIEVPSDYVQGNIGMTLFCLVLVVVALALLRKIHTGRQKTHFHHNYNMANPFSLEEFDDVDVLTPFEDRKRLKNAPKMIY